MEIYHCQFKNLNRTVSKYQHIKYLSGSLKRETVLDNLSTNGYCLYKNTNLHKDLFSDNHTIISNTSESMQKCVFGDDYTHKLMNYSIGTDARDEHKNTSLLSVSKIASTHWVPYHNELLYTNEFPLIISFLCIKPSETGGQTPFSNTIDIYNALPNTMKNKFNKYGIMYIRNLRDKTAEMNVQNNRLELGGQKFMQDIFNTNDRSEVEYLCDGYGYEYEWNVCAVNKTPILRIKYVAPAIIEYKFGRDSNIVRSFANSVTGMNGRYFKNYNEYYEGLEYIDRPFHSLFGNGEEFNDIEYDMIENLYDKYSIKFQWNEGDIFIADNLCWAHGRLPYEGERNILVMMGEPYVRYPFMVAQKII